MTVEANKELGQEPVKVFLEDAAYIPAYWPKDKNIVIDACGLHVCLAEPLNALTNPEEKREFLRILQKAGREIRGLGYCTLVLSMDGAYKWDRAFTSAWLRGYHQSFGTGVVLLPEELSSDVAFMKEEEIISWVRRVIDLPANQLTPLSMGTELDKLCQIVGSGLTFKAISGASLEASHLVGLMTVGGGSVNKPCLYELSWTPEPGAQTFAGLVGKGITFDTGGYSLKPSEFMRSMHSDMGGAATVAGAMALAAVRGFKHNLKACLCCAENVISGSAMKVGDLITYPNGVSVEIANTDAEGRLVLADGLLRVADCRYVVDVATLTGAAKVALGRDYNAALSLNTKLSNLFEEAATEEYEYAWRLPFAPMHLSLVTSSFADITNSASGDSLPGATTAAAFLSRFVTNKDTWLHIDLAASYQKVANSLYAAGGKGHGVRSLVHYLEKLDV